MYTADYGNPNMLFGMHIEHFIRKVSGLWWNWWADGHFQQVDHSESISLMIGGGGGPYILVKGKNKKKKFTKKKK